MTNTNEPFQFVQLAAWTKELMAFERLTNFPKSNVPNSREPRAPRAGTAVTRPQLACPGVGRHTSTTKDVTVSRHRRDVLPLRRANQTPDTARPAQRRVQTP